MFVAAGNSNSSWNEMREEEMILKLQYVIGTDSNIGIIVSDVRVTRRVLPRQMSGITLFKKTFPLLFRHRIEDHLSLEMIKRLSCHGMINAFIILSFPFSSQSSCLFLSQSSITWNSFTVGWLSN